MNFGRLLNIAQAGANLGSLGACLFSLSLMELLRPLGLWSQDQVSMPLTQNFTSVPTGSHSSPKQRQLELFSGSLYPGPVLIMLRYRL